MDIWSDQNRGSYIALTSHWITHGQDGNLTLCLGLLGFYWFFGTHGGDCLCKALLHLLNCASITPKVSWLCYPHQFDLMLR